MPAIFTQQNRDELYRRIIEAGWEQLVEGGIRSLRVERVTAVVGIAKGTFYNFFDSKDDFIYAMLTENRQRVMDALMARASLAVGTKHLPDRDVRGVPPSRAEPAQRADARPCFRRRARALDRG